jgi:hypothetical protein
MLAGDTTACWEPTMSHLRLVPPFGTAAPAAVVDDRPRVSLRLLMAASGRCSCDACVIAYRLGDKKAGLVTTPRPTATRLTAVR